MPAELRCESATVYTHRRHYLLLLLIPKADTHFTVPSGNTEMWFPCQSIDYGLKLSLCLCVCMYDMKGADGYRRVTLTLNLDRVKVTSACTIHIGLLANLTMWL